MGVTTLVSKLKFACAVLILTFCLSEGSTKFSIKMPDVSPKKTESYLCTAKELPNDDMYAVTFDPVADMETAHHMLVFGCLDIELDNSIKDYWDCTDQPPCQKEETIIYAWAKNAKQLLLPSSVGVRLGEKSRIKYIVLQVHYARPLDDDEVDGSSVNMELTHSVPKFLSGIYLLESSQFAIPPKTVGYHVDIACVYDGRPVMPFAFRTHAHERGRSISAYRIRGGQWTQIGIGSPQRPQAFYLIDKKERMVIKKGDIIAARCTYDSPAANGTIFPGAYSTDEMCNFYMMVYMVNKASGVTLPRGCFSQKVSLPSSFPSDSYLPDPLTTPATTSAVTTTMGAVRTPLYVSPPTFKRSTSPETSPTHSTKTKEIQRQSTQPIKSDHLGPLPVLDEDWSVKYDSIGEICGLAIHDEKHLTVLHRADRKWDESTFDDEHYYLGLSEKIQSPTLLQVDIHTGEMVKTIGSDLFYLPHGLTIDHKGNYWITDVALHQVFMFNPDNLSTPKRLFGVHSEPGNDDKHFCSPTDVAVDQRGYSYIADGYCNNRIMKFSPDGVFLYKWGEQKPGSPQTELGVLNSPRSLALDHVSGRLYVCERKSARIQVFDLFGTALQTITQEQFGTPLAAITFNNNYGGILYVLNEADILGNVKGFTVSTSTGDIINTWNAGTNGLKEPRDLALSPDNRTLYVADRKPHALWRFVVNNPHGTLQQKKNHVIPLSEKTLISSIDIDKIQSSEEKKKSFEEDDVSMVPAIVVVVVLATPILLVLIAAIVQHLRFKQKRKKAVAKLHRNPMKKRHVELCFGCCATPNYFYKNKQRGFDDGLLQVNSDVTSSDDDDEDDLFSRKA